MTLPDSIEIRVLEPGDVNVLRDLLRCFGEVFSEPATYCSRQPDDNYLSELLADSGFVAIAALDKQEVIAGLAGYLLRKFEQPRSEFYVYDLAVREPYRRRGIATALIRESQRVARDRGAWVIFVQADLVDGPARELYSRFGVREDVAHYDIPVE
jgi:aminoglycoside 3-N-acetyltransferase I